MRKAFAALAALLLLIVVAQFFFAASGAFGDSYAAHHALGYVIFLVPVAMIAVAVPARVPGRLIALSALICVLTSLQVLIAVAARAIGEDSVAGRLVFGLHALNALAMLAVTCCIAYRARALAGS
ncbi:DUF6220 domain-containing protein [Dactylosporangium sp. NPDC051485]|uniref:DUF6220 domain-containing protein n=1 Tax=Dactylosporangium sp. NPDC051485 TaxID=3154846 RepID=UPI00343ED672